jgi:peptide-methionine (S)-S-oxide reductase
MKTGRHLRLAVLGLSVALLAGCSRQSNGFSGGDGVMIPPIDANRPAETEIATFALGWFWGADSRFGSLDGVISTQVGYAGGTKENPTYYSLGDHSETVRVEYDPTQISYQQLLDVFWASHSPNYPPVSQQYASIVFYHNEEQRRLAEETKQREQDAVGGEIYTEIIPATEFYLAEDYHQKYYLRQVPELIRDMSTIYPETIDLVASTAAARINGYLGGHGSLEVLEAQIDSFGLSAEGKAKLLEIASRRLGGAVCSLK